MKISNMKFFTHENFLTQKFPKLQYINCVYSTSSNLVVLAVSDVPNDPFVFMPLWTYMYWP